MYSALIVEDEMLVRHGIKSMLDWRAAGIDKVFEASNGLDAYELYGREHPDIILTDLKMPVMDGMTLIRTIRESDKDAKTRFVIMSCLDEFPLVQQALNFGVTHYFLKVTASCEDIQAVLSRITRELEEASPQEQGGAMLCAEELLQNFSGDCIMSTTEAESVFAALDFDPGKPYALSAVHITRRVGRQNISLPGYNTLGERLNEILGAPVKLIRISAGMYAVLFAEQQAKIFVGMTEEQYARLAGDDGVRVQVGLSRHVSGAMQLSQALNQAFRALEACFFQDRAVFLYESLESFSIPDDKAMRLLSIPGGFIHLPGKFVDTYEGKMRQITQRRYASSDAFKKSLGAMVVWLSTQTDCICDSMEDMSIECTHQITASHSLAEAIAAFEQFASEIISLSSFSTKMPPGITAALLYIHANLDHPLTLNEIAGHTHLNPSYLSTLFHKVMRVSLIGYINSVRIERAKMLLRSTDLSISRIASVMGFSQDIYFYRLFKRIVRKTPTEYRARYQRSEDPPASLE